MLRKQFMVLRILLPALLVLISLTGGCNSSSPRIEGGGHRYVYDSLFIQTSATSEGNTITGKAPLDIALIVNFGLSAKDSGSVADITQKVEVSYGDSSGWVDVTGHAQAFWDYSLADTAKREFHTYSNPGSYHLSSRVTYWDGEVVEAALGDQFDFVIEP
jgi:hypothetical protein